MGLDMMLYKTKKVEGVNSDKLIAISNAIYEHIKEDEDLKSIDLSSVTGIEAANEFKPYIKKRGDFIIYFSPFEEIGYWRKANHIHAWFVDNVQNNVDDCGIYPVSKAQLKKLKGVCQLVLNNMDHAATLLPTQSGFFFGSTDYDEYYKRDVEDTMRILSKAIDETDFDKEMIVYSSSW
ncbi:hypothetical protein [Bacillus atrophaeus]|uniref:hypothetical protein n=1 Tax=Bacillus atrophaeus TaxID=1452 RepID=UPI002E2021BF|nr:hypothetical protein [Bacillus atrophaeus]